YVSEDESATDFETSGEEAYCPSDRVVFYFSLVHYPYLVAAPSQLQLPQPGVDTEGSGSFQDFWGCDHLISQLDYSVELAGIKVIQLPSLAGVEDLDLWSIQVFR
ncbi:unnamed protein product, partial [Dibothriocephalus latus]